MVLEEKSIQTAEGLQKSKHRLLGIAMLGKKVPKSVVEKILEYKNMQRENDPHKWIEQKGYDIKKETKKLDDFYLEKSNLM